MSSFDYNAPAELFLSKPTKGSRTNIGGSQRRLHCYPVEDLRTPRAFGAWLQIGDERFNSVEIQRLAKKAHDAAKLSPRKLER